MGRLPPARDGACVMCGVRGQHRHERLTRGRGGLRDAFNSVVLCARCHEAVTRNPEWAESIGMYIRGRMIRGVYVGPDKRFRLFYNDEVWDDHAGWIPAREALT